MSWRCSNCGKELSYALQNGKLVWWECGCGNSWQQGSQSKPPIGLMPRKFWDEKRLNEVSSAIARYINACRPVPPEWIEEYNELVERLA